MASNYQDEDIQAAWGDVFSRDKYRIMISCIADNYPQKKSVSSLIGCAISERSYKSKMVNGDSSQSLSEEDLVINAVTSIGFF